MILKIKVFVSVLLKIHIIRKMIYLYWIKTQKYYNFEQIPKYFTYFTLKCLHIINKKYFPLNYKKSIYQKFNSPVLFI